MDFEYEMTIVSLEQWDEYREYLDEVVRDYLLSRGPSLKLIIVPEKQESSLTTKFVSQLGQ